MLSGLISAVIWVIIATQGTGVLTEVIWFKIFCSGLFIVRHIKRKQLEIPFFRNTGLWETPLWTGAIGIDLLTFMTGVIILIKHV